MQAQRSMRGIQLVTHLRRPTPSLHSSYSRPSSKDPFDRGEIVMVRASAMRAFEEAAKECLEQFNQCQDNLEDTASSLARTPTLYSQINQELNFRPAVVKRHLPDVGLTEVYLLATFGKTPYQEIYEHTRDIVIPVANKIITAEDLPVVSVKTDPVWPFAFEYVITKSIVISEVKHWYPDGTNRYWMKREDLTMLSVIGSEQMENLASKLLEHRGGANGWLKDIRREARKVSSGTDGYSGR
ncbi:hypothetical protein VKT23_004718 [Stygiomarasmius scandens]|uniref:Uncharacterized protein n=1 Tax=Marasmiellus scandens TaxID=2682957 RepID=A0ABR1JVG6_9AGAR